MHVLNFTRIHHCTRLLVFITALTHTGPGTDLGVLVDTTHSVADSPFPSGSKRAGGGAGNATRIFARKETKAAARQALEAVLLDVEIRLS